MGNAFGVTITPTSRKNELVPKAIAKQEKQVSKMPVKMYCGPLNSMQSLYHCSAHAGTVEY